MKDASDSFKSYVWMRVRKRSRVSSSSIGENGQRNSLVQTKVITNQLYSLHKKLFACESLNDFMLRLLGSRQFLYPGLSAVSLVSIH